MNAKNVIGILLITNLALLGGIVYLAKNPRESKPAAATSLPHPATNAQPVARKKSIEVVTNNAPAQKFDWNAVESADYKEYIANLRAIGCPEETIRDIIIADVNKLFAARLKVLAGPRKKFEFWKSGAIMGGMMDTERTEKERSLNKEKRTLLTELLGSPPEEKADILAGAAGQLEAMFDFLPNEKRTKVFEAMQDMQTKMAKSMKGGAPDADEVRKLMKESEATLAGILTPEELLDYNLRFSMTANMMRMQSTGFEPSEQEFLEVFKARKAYDDESGTIFGAALSTAERERADAAKKELETNLKQTLGANRYAEYERAQDYNYQNLAKIGDRNGLQPAAVNQAYDMDKISRETIQKLFDDKTLDGTQRDEAIKQIRNETQNSIKAVLGEKAFESYTNRPGRF